MNIYGEMSDLDDHIIQFRQKMLTLSIQFEVNEACMCKGFEASLDRLALQWYICLPTNSIYIFLFTIGIIVCAAVRE